MKRFLLIIMTVIFTLMLATTAYATDDSIRMAFDEKTIRIIAQEDCTTTLNITVQIGEKEEIISKAVKLPEKTTVNLNVEDIVFEEFSDWYNLEEVQITNVFIEQSTPEEMGTFGLITLIGVILIIVSAAVGGYIWIETSHEVLGQSILEIGIGIGFALAVSGLISMVV